MMVWDIRCPAIMCNRSNTAYQAPVLAVQVSAPTHFMHLLLHSNCKPNAMTFPLAAGRRLMRPSLNNCSATLSAAVIPGICGV